jgi:hypothetical protein
MLRSGLVLFITSSLGVALRSMEVDAFTGPTVKMICSLALLASVACFLATYCVTEYAHSKARLHR